MYDRRSGGMHGAPRKIGDDRSGTVDEGSGDAEDEIFWQLFRAHVLPNDAVLPCREPVLDLRRSSCHGSDILKHFQALKIARIEPSKVRLAGLGKLPIHEPDHRRDPLWIGETIESSLVGVTNTVGAEVPLEGIAFLTNASLNLSELAPDLTRLRWDAPSVAGHLRWL